MSNICNECDFKENGFMGTIISKKIFFNDGSIDFKILNVNKSLESIMGVNKDNIIGDSITEILGGDRSYLLSLFCEVAVKGEENSININSRLNNRALRINIIKIDDDLVLTQVKHLSACRERCKELHKYKLFLDNSLDIILILTTKGEVIDCNKQALIEYGYSKSQIQNLSILDIRGYEHKQFVENQLRLANEEGITFESLHYRMDGSAFLAEVKAVGVGVGEEKVIFSIIRNISDRKKKELETKQLAAIVESSQDAIFIRELDGTIVSWNYGAQCLFGYTSDEIIGQNISKIVPQKAVEVINEDSRRLSIGETINKFEAEFITKTGDVVIGSVNVSSMKIEEKGEMLASLIVRDLTEDKKKGREIEKLSMALEQSSSGIVTTDLEGNIEYVNRKFEYMAGYKRDDITGINIKSLNSTTVEKEFYDNILSMMAVKNEFIGEFAAINSNESIVWVRVSLSPIKEIDNNIIGFLAVIDDVTENRNLIDDLNEKNKELEETIKLLKETQLQLINEEKMASIGQLASGIAHEINNPVGFVLSNLDTLKKYVSKFEDIIHNYRLFKDAVSTKYGSDLKNEIDNIEKIEQANKINFIKEDLIELLDDTDEGIERIRNIVNALRNFGHKDPDGNMKSYDINEGIKNTLIITRNETKYISNVITNLSNVPKINANGSEINQVLLNLIVNASQAIKEKVEREEIKNAGFGKIQISSSCDDNFVYCSIEDNGNGIKKELINKVVEPFFTTKPVGRGTGLGLSISYDIIHNKHNGELIIESVEGQGTKITIKIPIK